MDKQVLLETVLREIKAPIFLAEFDSQHAQLTLHASKGRDFATLQAAGKRLSNDAAVAIKVHVRAHGLRKLAYPRSLEHWLRQFGADEIIYDPTMVISRARGLLMTAKSCRAALGTAIAGLYFEPDRRTIFVHARGNNDPASLSALNLRLHATMQQAWKQTTGRTADQPIWNSVQVVGQLPNRDLVPIDAKSASTARSVRRALRRWFAPLAVALALAGIAVPAAANVDPLQSVKQSTATKATANHKFGILGALSVFGDPAVPVGVDVFASAGLQEYFGGGGRHVEKGIRVAAQEQRRRRRHRIPEEIGQVGGGS
jgi:hypothetical protein